MKRRDVMRAGLAVGGSLALLQACQRAAQPKAAAARPPGAVPDAGLAALAQVALEAAVAAGATYADVRISEHRQQGVSAQEHRIVNVSDNDSSGFGVRVLANGTWGYAASNTVSKAELVRVAKQAVAVARENAPLQREPVQLAPVGTYHAVWNTPLRRDAFAVTIQEKAERILSLNVDALKRPGVEFVTSWMVLAWEHKFFASTEGSVIEQTLQRISPGFVVTSVDRKKGSFQTRTSYTTPVGMGYEYVEEYPWDDDLRQAADDVVAKHSAPSVEPGPRDLILHPTHLWLTIHESIGHPTELDRALGMEANFAGTSFLTTDKLGKAQIGSEIVNIRAEKTAPGSLATCGYDDDGAQTMEWPLVEAGRFVDYQLTRDQAHWIGRARGHACSYSQSWKDVPFQRMPNVNLVPPENGPTLNELIADTEHAILIHGNGSFSIDHQRYNFQFGGQTFWEVKNGKVTGMLKDVAYQSRTPDFWKSCDAICGKSEYATGGSMNDGKGEPFQSNAVSHGCPAARFRQINVLNTARDV